LPVPETQPNLVPQEERENASSLARRAHLHRKRRISYDTTSHEEVLGRYIGGLYGEV
jgi:hypothetical protein